MQRPEGSDEIFSDPSLKKGWVEVFKSVMPYIGGGRGERPGNSVDDEYL